MRNMPASLQPVAGYLDRSSAATCSGMSTVAWGGHHMSDCAYPLRIQKRMGNIAW